MSEGSENDIARPSARPFPESTYRLQFHAGFKFTDAARIAPYLRDLGITHVYASPYLKARPGSTHGYDIVDHRVLNPEVGTPEEHDAFVAALRENGLGLILDIVPNHMGVATDENPWWTNILENGPSSPFAGYFDIAWKATARSELVDKVLLPVLGEPYGDILESGQLKLAFENGAFTIRYYERHFPVAPRSYAIILGHRAEDLEKLLGGDALDFAEYQSILTAIRHLPDRTETEPARVAERQREKEIVKRRLGELAARSEAVRGFIGGNVALFNGTPGEPRSFDRLDDLLSHQSYRLSFWRVALEEINYRRFFDVNDLAALSTERQDVFDAVHCTIFRLIDEGKVDGLRVDHPDGLYDPKGYFDRLQARGPMYVVAEKILGHGEPLPGDWKVSGTTGYEFLNAVNGLFVDGNAERAFTDFYRDLIDEPVPFPESVYRSKRLTLLASLAGELNTLAHQLDRLAQRSRHSRDFTLNGLRGALREVIACFPVYRSYITAAGVSDSDRKVVEQAVTRAASRNPLMSGAILRFLRAMILLEYPNGATDEEKAEQVRFAGKFQQVTSPVMAKGLEDTSFYIFNRLLSLNEVGGHPGRFGITPDDLHKANAERRDKWPRSMTTLSTHDTKRSEDVRARINVLSEMPEEWAAAVKRWRDLNAVHRPEVDHMPAPDANEEFGLYQSILGAWDSSPLSLGGSGVGGEGDRETQTPHPGPKRAGPLPQGERVENGFAERIAAYAIKALHEAKVHSSWINPNATYDAAVQEFVKRILDPVSGKPFLDDFVPFARRIARAGAVNSLAQTLLKITSPGVPDTYQGTELPDFSLVDPDNRRPVDYELRRRMLDDVRKDATPEFARRLGESLEDGRAKLYLTWRALTLRREHPGLFAEGEYLPLTATGPDAHRVFAFAGRRNGAEAVVVVPRLGLLAGRASDGSSVLPSLARPANNGADTHLPLTGLEPAARYRDLFTGREFTPTDGGLAIAELFADFPVALLMRG